MASEDTEEVLGIPRLLEKNKSMRSRGGELNDRSYRNLRRGSSTRSKQSTSGKGKLLK